MSQVDYLGHFGNDLMVVNAARVSFGKWKDKLDDKDVQLIKYLATHGHDSPFFHCVASFRITAPIYVARQLFRHEVGGSKNEVSRRYVTDEPTIEMPGLLYGKAAGGNKQGDGEVLGLDTDAKARSVISTLYQQAIHAYGELVKLGVSPGQARIVLPLATNTTWIWTGSLAFYARVCRLRLSKDAQVDTQDVVWEIDRKMEELFPVSWKALLTG